MATSPSLSRWVQPVRRTEEPAVRLFCMPYAGGGATIFRSWAKELHEDIELCPIHLPGRDERMGEPLMRRVEPMAGAIAEAIMPLLDRPYALLGYSMGSLVAFEVARALRRRGAPSPARLFACARRAPHSTRRVPAIHHLDDAAFIEAVQTFNGLPEALLQNEELLAIFLPIMRADFEVLDHYVYTPEPPLDCPISVFGGDPDPTVHAGDLAAWGELTTAGARVTHFPGGHFFLRTARRALLYAIERELL